MGAIWKLQYVYSNNKYCERTFYFENGQKVVIADL